MPKQFAQPTPGKSIRVTTRFPDHYYWATSPWQDNTYQGVVGRPDRSVPEGSFMLLTPQDRNMPTRVIALCRVIALEYADGTQARTSDTKDEVRVWQVQGSKGNVYTVTQRGASKTCTCPGFQFRKDCKHVH
nr:SWIM zinc finger family protein [Oxalobacteraceae bacterium]